MDVQPEIAAQIAQTDGFIEGRSSEPHPALVPQSGDVVLTKRRVSAFAGSDLDVILLAGRIDALVPSGIAASGCVLSTPRQAADLDFSLTVLSDGCIDDDDDVHRLLCEKVFPSQADVLTIDTWISGLSDRGASRRRRRQLAGPGRYKRGLRG
jgi:nicotinamidase-related amidase